jgi:hypothetical protein
MRLFDGYIDRRPLMERDRSGPLGHLGDADRHGREGPLVGAHAATAVDQPYAGDNAVTVKLQSGDHAPAAPQHSIAHP